VIKLVFTLRRKPELSREEFQRIWFDEHGPLVRKHADVLGIRRYVQVHTSDTPLNDVLRGSRDAPEEYDGVAELWYDSIDAIAEAASTSEGAEAARQLLEDERRFIEHKSSPLWFAVERPVIDA
jgi:uncharacterized protein (TIGR02118 family)